MKIRIIHPFISAGNIRICMISLSFVLLTHAINLKSTAQNPTVHFSYDLNGNRILRSVQVLKMEEADSADTVFIDRAWTKRASENLSEGDEIKVFPNPTDGNLNIKKSGAMANECATIQLFTIEGRENLRTEQCEPSGTLDISSFSPGTYILLIQTAPGKKERWKISKQ